MFRQNPKLDALAGPSIQAMVGDGRTLSAADYLGAIADLALFRRTVADIFGRYDLLVTPSAAALPWAADKPYPTEIDGKPAGPRGHAIYTGWVNAAGLPAIALPMGLSKAGLPMGGQLIGRFGSDAGLLAFAREIELKGGLTEAWPAFAEG